MADKIEHFVAGQPNFPERLNELVDVVNRLAEQAEAKTDTKPATKRAVK